VAEIAAVAEHKARCFVITVGDLPSAESIKTARRYRTIEIQAGRQTITAADPVPTTSAKPVDAVNRPHLTQDGA
jgi:hypothetical protein